MTTTINLHYTDRAREVLSGADNSTFHYETGAPFPQTGDFLETDLAGGTQTFIVIGRVFRYRTDEIVVNVYLDLPPGQEPDAADSDPSGKPAG
jgi:hypothetical protein